MDILLLFTSSSTDKHSDCFPPFDIVNDVAVNISVQISIQVPTFILWGIFPEVQLLN